MTSGQEIRILQNQKLIMQALILLLTPEYQREAPTPMLVKLRKQINDLEGFRE